MSVTRSRWHTAVSSRYKRLRKKYVLETKTRKKRREKRVGQEDTEAERDEGPGLTPAMSFVVRDVVKRESVRTGAESSEFGEGEKKEGGDAVEDMFAEVEASDIEEIALVDQDTKPADASTMRLGGNVFQPPIPDGYSEEEDTCGKVGRQDSRGRPSGGITKPLMRRTVDVHSRSTVTRDFRLRGRVGSSRVEQVVSQSGLLPSRSGRVSSERRMHLSLSLPKGVGGASPYSAPADKAKVVSRPLQKAMKKSDAVHDESKMDVSSASKPTPSPVEKTEVSNSSEQPALADAESEEKRSSPPPSRLSSSSSPSSPPSMTSRASDDACESGESESDKDPAHASADRSLVNETELVDPSAASLGRVSRFDYLFLALSHILLLAFGLVSSGVGLLVLVAGMDVRIVASLCSTSAICVGCGVYGYKISMIAYRYAVDRDCGQGLEKRKRLLVGMSIALLTISFILYIGGLAFPIAYGWPDGVEVVLTCLGLHMVAFLLTVIIYFCVRRSLIRLDRDRERARRRLARKQKRGEEGSTVEKVEVGEEHVDALRRKWRLPPHVAKDPSFLAMTASEQVEVLALMKLQAFVRGMRGRVRAARMEELHHWRRLVCERRVIGLSLYFLLAATTLFAFYINILFVVKFSPEVGREWALAAAASFMTDLLIQQPLVVFLKTILLLALALMSHRLTRKSDSHKLLEHVYIS